MQKERSNNYNPKTDRNVCTAQDRELKWIQTFAAAYTDLLLTATLLLTSICNRNTFSHRTFYFICVWFGKNICFTIHSENRFAQDTIISFFFLFCNTNTAIFVHHKFCITVYMILSVEYFALLIVSRIRCLSGHFIKIDTRA